jgi:predicted phosphodiesterase
MTAPVAILSDIHGNSPALEVALDDICRAGCEQLYVLGDIVNGVDPQGCLALLRAWPGAACLKGNAEHYLLTPDLDGLPGREEPVNILVRRLVEWWRARLSPADLDWLGALPEAAYLDGACLVHDRPQDRLEPWRWRRPGIDDRYQEWLYHSRGIPPGIAGQELDELLAFLEGRGFTGVFCGHTHLPFARREGGRLICNAGSVGYPLDGDPRASWALYDPGAGPAQAVSIRRVAYDLPRILRMVDAADDFPDFVHQPGFREAYRCMLETGIHWREYLPGGRS